MSVENPLWGAPRIHGELLKLGFEVAQSSVAKYMVKRRGPPSQGWKTFLRNHPPDIAAMDLFVVPTIGFKLLYGFVIVRLHRRDLVWINVTANPTAEWVARQITEAFPWDGAPRYMIRDCDRIYGAVVTRRLRAEQERAHFGRIEILVNNVGGTIWAKPFAQYEEAQIEAEIRRSLFPTLWCCRAVSQRNGHPPIGSSRLLQQNRRKADIGRNADAA
jgi:hypothetical protein